MFGVSDPHGARAFQCGINMYKLYIVRKQHSIINTPELMANAVNPNMSSPFDVEIHKKKGNVYRTHGAANKKKII